jgi:hypothetical protein
MVVRFIFCQLCRERCLPIKIMSKWTMPSWYTRKASRPFPASEYCNLYFFIKATSSFKVSVTDRHVKKRRRYLSVDGIIVGNEYS